MKIVIDIPDEAYEMLKNKQVLDNIAESIIANGTPYEERPQGEWIEDIENLLYRCSNCNASSNIRMFKSNLHFCPNCGADMRKEVENE